MLIIKRYSVKYWIPKGFNSLNQSLKLFKLYGLKNCLLLLFCPNGSRPGQRPGHLLFHQVIWPGMTWFSAATAYNSNVSSDT